MIIQTSSKSGLARIRACLALLLITQIGILAHDFDAKHAHTEAECELCIASERLDDSSIAADSVPPIGPTLSGVALRSPAPLTGRPVLFASSRSPPLSI